MPKIERTITTTAPPEQVWTFMSDFTTTEQWDPPTVRTLRVSGDGGVGTVYRNTSKVMGRESDLTYTVIDCEPPRLLRLKGENETLEAIDTVEVDGVDTGTLVRYTADFSLKGAARLAAPLLPLGLKRLGDSAAEQLARCLNRLT